MDIKVLLDNLNVNHVFQDWKKENENAFLAHVFVMCDGDNIVDKQVGFFNTEKNKMTSFVISGEKITKMPEADVFQKPGSSINPLDEEKINSDFDDAMETADDLLKTKYEAIASKKIFILQKIDVGQVWNITYLTNKLSTINIKIDSDNAKVLKDEEINIIDFKKSG